MCIRDRCRNVFISYTEAWKNIRKLDEFRSRRARYVTRWNLSLHYAFFMTDANILFQHKSKILVWISKYLCWLITVFWPVWFFFVCNYLLISDQFLFIIEISVSRDIGLQWYIDPLSYNRYIIAPVFYGSWVVVELQHIAALNIKQ